MTDDEGVSSTVGPDSNGRRSALLAGDAVRPWCVGSSLGRSQKRLEVSIALSTAEIPTRPLNLTADALSERDPLRPICEQDFDPPPGLAQPAIADQFAKAVGLFV